MKQIRKIGLRFAYFVVSAHLTALITISQTNIAQEVKPTPDSTPVIAAFEKKEFAVPTQTPMAMPKFNPKPTSNRKATSTAIPAPTPDDDNSLPPYLKDRGTGIPTSQFGTYIKKGEGIVYTFYEYYHDHNFEYMPEEFGVKGNLTDFRGKFRAHEGLVFVAYGVTDRVSVEFEFATIKADFEKSPLDTSALPYKIKESGLGDVEGQIRWRWNKESEHRPEIFSYAEVVIPHHKNKVLIGTPGVELKFGTGLIKGFSWGTMTFRGSIQYSNASTSKFDMGEFAVEYLKRLSPKLQLYLGVEGKQDELSVIPQIQWFVTKNVFVKVNSGFGITSRAPDFTPEIGVGFRFDWKH